MATAADAAREFVTGPQVIQAARLLLSRFTLGALCEALVGAKTEDAADLTSALEGLAEYEEVRTAFLADEVIRFLQAGAVAPDPRIRRLIARLLVRLVQEGEAAVTQLIDAGLIAACQALLMDEETGTAEAAAGTIRSVVRWPAGFRAVLGDGGGGDLSGGLQQGLQSYPDVQKIRVLHLFVELGRASQEAFAVLEAREAYRAVIGAFLTGDILLKLNAVELMDAMGSFPHGQELLARGGVPEQLASDLADPMCDDSVRLCVTRLLGLIVFRAPGTMSTLLPGKEAPLAQAIAQMLDGRDPAGRLCALNAWANVSAHKGGLAFFLGWPQLMEEILALAASPQNEVCKGAMACWAEVLTAWPPPTPGSDDAGGAVPLLWSLAETRVLPTVLKNLPGKPFPDVRCTSWRLLAALIQSRAAAQQALPSDEIRDLLLDFTSETNADARRAKHDFVVALTRCHSSWLIAFLSEEVEGMLSEYARQGPFWVPRQAEAAVGQEAG